MNFHGPDFVTILDIGITRCAFSEAAPHDPWVLFELNLDLKTHFADRREDPHTWGFAARATLSRARLTHIDGCLDYAYSQHIVDQFVKEDKNVGKIPKRYWNL